jgi:ABC-type enterobactin transport system permease subunit
MEGERIERRRMTRLVAPLMAVAAALLVAGTLVAISLSIPTLANSSARSCDVGLQVRDAFRDLVVRAQALSAENPHTTPAQQRVAADFYNASLRRINAIHC